MQCIVIPQYILGFKLGMLQGKQPNNTRDIPE